MCQHNMMHESNRDVSAICQLFRIDIIIGQRPELFSYKTVIKKLLSDIKTPQYINILAHNFSFLQLL